MEAHNYAEQDLREKERKEGEERTCVLLEA